ncbi:MAG: hypothetical protein IPO87_06355 [Flavobacteriales bacterium]|nr:hypothetical protein [Flavobacteriales bacterium]
MKTLLPLLFLLVSITSVAQTTNYSGFNYQAVVRDAQGQPLPNQIVGVQILIRESPLDLTGYVENHNVTSDAQGLITLTIGQGTVDGSSVVANFGDIDWRSAGAMAYSISMDITGGTNYQYLGGSVLQAVPYAMHALTSENSGWVVNMDTLENAGKQVNITNSTGDAPLSVISEAYGFEHLYDYGAGVGTVKLSSYLGSATDPTDAGGWFGTKSEHPLYLYTNDGLPQVTLNTSGNLGVGTMLPEARLDVAGTFKFADGSEGTGKFLTSDGDGNASWQNLSAESLLGSGNVPSGDLSCLSNVATIATGTQPSAISFSGNFAYVLNNNSNNMMVFDISDPRAPGLSATIATGTNPSAVAVSGNFAYVVNAGSNNMLVFDISTPSAPVLSTTIATGSLPLSIAVSGNYAYVLNWISSNMMVFDLTTPGTPSLSATIATGGSPEQVIVSGNYAYVLNGNSTLMVYDIGNPVPQASAPRSPRE